MKKIDKALIDTLSRDCKFQLSAEEEAEILAEKTEFMTMLSYLNLIDTEAVKPMCYPFEAATSYLRPDEISHISEQKLIFKNAPHREGDYFEVVEVVKKA